MKYFRMSYEEVVFNRSYINIMLLNRSIPSFKTKENDGEDKSDNIEGETPRKLKKMGKNKPMAASDYFMQFM